MGLLKHGNTLNWQGTKKISDSLKDVAISQLIKNFKIYGNLEKKTFKWGYELEYFLLQTNPLTHKVQPWIMNGEFLDELKYLSLIFNI